MRQSSAIYRGLSQSKKHLSCLLCVPLVYLFAPACFILWLRFNPCSHAFDLPETVFYLFWPALLATRPLKDFSHFSNLKNGPMLYAWYYSCYQADDILTFTFPSTPSIETNITPLIVNEFWTYSFAPSHYYYHHHHYPNAARGIHVNKFITHTHYPNLIWERGKTL